MCTQQKWLNLRTISNGTFINQYPKYFIQQLTRVYPILALRSLPTTLSVRAILVCDMVYLVYNTVNTRSTKDKIYTCK